MTTRVLTTIIPERKVTKAIVSVPAAEWNRMRWVRGILSSCPMLLLLSMFIIPLFGGLYLPGLLEQGGFDPNNNSHLFGFLAATLVIALPVAFAFVKLDRKATALESDLLKKHGWNGKMDYEVELELLIAPRPEQLETPA